MIEDEEDELEELQVADEEMELTEDDIMFLEWDVT